jgi:hypothetical protein
MHRSESDFYGLRNSAPVNRCKIRHTEWASRAASHGTTCQHFLESKSELLEIFAKYFGARSKPAIFSEIRKPSQEPAAKPKARTGLMVRMPSLESDDCDRLHHHTCDDPDGVGRTSSLEHLQLRDRISRVTCQGAESYEEEGGEEEGERFSMTWSASSASVVA